RACPSGPPGKRVLGLVDGDQVRLSQDDGSRRREYIGADPEAQTEALARVKARDELQAVKNEMREVNHRLAAITGHLARALLAAAKGFDPYW
ncbi:MAG: hypothetical protein HWN51_07490, partial [Desulfobacterales bacterium]|nr:hypothetical protein [Desulfobacterales bacterium]